VDSQELSAVAAEIARFVIEQGRVEKDEAWFITSLGAEVAFEADVRGYENATEIAEEAVRQYTQ
jgi:hypothetical protein